MQGWGNVGGRVGEDVGGGTEEVCVCNESYMTSKFIIHNDCTPLSRQHAVITKPPVVIQALKRVGRIRVYIYTHVCLTVVFVYNSVRVYILLTL